MDEYWDIYDKNRNKTGRIHKRGLELNEGEYHLVVEIWVINSKGEILVTKRHPNKHFGNLWECTGGSAVVGEDSLTGAKRELLEEVGIVVNQEPMKLLGTWFSKNHFTDSYVVKKDMEIGELTLQQEEVIDAKWVSLDEFNQMAKEGFIVPILVERFNYYIQGILSI